MAGQTTPVRDVAVPDLHAEAERRALLRVAAAAAGTGELPAVVELAAEEALAATGAASLTVGRFEDDRTIFRPLINVGRLADWEERYPEDDTYEVAGIPPLVDLTETGRPRFSSLDDPRCDPATAALLRSSQKFSGIVIAILVEGEIWGAVWASTTESGAQFTSQDVGFLEAIGGQLGGAIARSQLFARVSRFAYEDGLTGLANRRAFEERLARGIDRHLAGKAGLGLLLCDVDRLKGINDELGHAAGDEALKCVAGALVAAAAEHPSAFVARLGGDEFCVLLESRPSVAVGGHEEILELAAAAQSFLTTDAPEVTISCGVALAGPRTPTASSLMAAADSAQYVAKRRGGNRVCTAAQAADLPDRIPSRAPVSDTVADRVAAAAASISRALNGPLAEAPVLDRLELVATKLAEVGDFARWTISVCESGSARLRDLSMGDNRYGTGEGMLVARSHVELSTYALDDYPVTAQVVAVGGGSFSAAVGDERSDPAEVALLEVEGFTGVVGAVASAEDAVYLVELSSDGPDGPMLAVEPVLALGVQAAMPLAPHRREGGPTRGHNRALELSLALADRLAGATAEHQVCEAAVDEVKRAFGCAYAQLVALDDGRIQMRAERPAITDPGWLQSVETGLIGRSIREGAPVIAADVFREPQFRTTKSTVGVRSELVAPIVIDGETWGAVNLEDRKIGAFSREDARLLESVAAQIGGALAAIALYQRLDRAYLGTAEALGAALEAKDAYTAQHSHSIAENAVAVGRRLGIDAAGLRMLRYAAAFHDIGKIAIPHEILNKPGALDEAEWSVMTRHTIVGERILAPIEFLAPIRPVVRSAHERWDGAGYPDGFAGEEIPPLARIIFACDAYDAMTTDRTYRAAMPESEAREELRRGSGTQFDPAVIEALLAELEAGSSSREERAAVTSLDAWALRSG